MSATISQSKVAPAQPVNTCPECRRGMRRWAKIWRTLADEVSREFALKNALRWRSSHCFHVPLNTVLNHAHATR